eukprot:TRINITY_DN2665_c2_g1_i1.p1 TRINITY_DN2665_c2_g1~~TRINITY_DN2665_c2_g1_i1.p1  ORF type:complete len:536 (+),score=80.97 TRINITY_DN2665_c2_g1_i1:88-1695(+)
MHGRYGSMFGFRDPGYNPAERMCESMCGAIFGIFVFIGSIVLLGWNEKRSVWTAQTIGLARDDMIQLDGGKCTPDSFYNDKLIAVHGCDVTPSDYANYNSMLRNVLTNGNNSTGTFGKAFKWKRTTSQYVMHETKSSSSHHDDDYDYNRKWVTSTEHWSNPHAIYDCNDIYYPYTICYVPNPWPAHQNDQQISSYACFGSATCDANNLTNASFVITSSMDSWSSGVVGGFGINSAVNIPQDFWPANGITPTGGTGLNCGGYLRSVTSAIPPQCSRMQDSELPSPFNNQYGTFKWEWAIRAKPSGPPSTSGLAVQYVDKNGRYSFKQWQNPHHSSCSYCTIGNFYNEDMTGEEILDRLESENKAMTWALRFVGWLIMWFGLQMMVSPIAVAPDFIPCIGGIIGDIVGLMLCALTCVVATSLSVLVIGIAWLAYRPAIGAPLVAAFIAGMIVAAFFAHHQRKNRKGYDDINTAQCSVPPPAGGAEYSHIVQQPVQQYGQVQQPAYPAAAPPQGTYPPPGTYPTPQAYPPAGGYPAEM